VKKDKRYHHKISPSLIRSNKSFENILRGRWRATTGSLKRQLFRCSEKAV